MKVLCFANKGAGSNEESRIVELLADLEPEVYAFDRAAKPRNVARILRRVRVHRPDIVVMEGTGVSGGLAVLLSRALHGVPFVVSSGDAVGPFLGTVDRRLSVPGWLYEVLLYRRCAGFIGWTPYLAGRALTLGAPRAMTAANFTLHPEVRLSREEVRDRLGVPRDALLAGIVGALPWVGRHGYCYGAELVRAVRDVRRPGVAVVVIGEGSGRERLRELAGDDLGRRVFLPGPIAHADVTSYLAAMDLGSLPQSTDQVGSFRYTTKISEYATARLPFVTGRIPLAYDLTDQWSWRLPGAAPWDPVYVDALRGLLETVTHEELQERRAAMPAALEVFDLDDQRRRVGAFVADLVADQRQGAPLRRVSSASR